MSDDYRLQEQHRLLARSAELTEGMLKAALDLANRGLPGDVRHNDAALLAGLLHALAINYATLARG